MNYEQSTIHGLAIHGLAIHDQLAAKPAIAAKPAVTAVDALFVTNQKRLPARIEQLMAETGLKWACAGIDEFPEVINHITLTGTVIVDTTEVTPKIRDAFIQALLRLDTQNVGIILVNNAIEFPFERFRLAAMLDSAFVDELWGRMRTHLAYRKSLSGPGTFPRRSKRLHDSTTEQLKMAGNVQQNFLPKQLPNSEQFRWATLFHPADWVSGDIYDITRLDETHIGFYIADAVGHSMPAALLTMFLKHAMVMRQTWGNDYEIFQPAEVVSNLNIKMVQQQLTGCLFATCCYCLLDTETLKLTFARAGHPYPVLLRPGQEPQQLQNRGGLLGVFESTQFDQQTIQLQQGDKIFVYSDGCENLVGICDENSRFIFDKRFTGIAQLPIGQMMDQFDRIVKSHVPAPAEIDDITAVGLEIL